MNRTKEILLTNPGYYTMCQNGYISGCDPINENTMLISYNKEYFN